MPRLIGRLAGVPAAVTRFTALDAKHCHVALEADVIFVRAVDLSVSFEPADGHGLRAGHSALNLHQPAFRVFNVLRGFLGKHWRVFTLWEFKEVLRMEEVRMQSWMSKDERMESSNTFDSDVGGTGDLPDVVHGRTEIFARVTFVGLQDGQVGGIVSTSDFIISSTPNIFVIFRPCDFNGGRASHVALKLYAVSYCHFLWCQFPVKDWRVSGFCRPKKVGNFRQTEPRLFDNMSSDTAEVKVTDLGG